MNNYPPNFNDDRVNPSEPELDEHDVVTNCLQCDSDVVREYWYKDGAREEPTGDLECVCCEVRYDEENQRIFV